ncbi:MAG TPA: helix-hairpin-helix domain-containing protein [Bacteroidales bacterium]|nr:helix-hairpin-helix domain-containing protein [Bacteroidales bacterium]
MIEYFKFSKGEWRAIFLLLILITLSFATTIFSKKIPSSNDNMEKFKREIAEFEAKQKQIADSLAVIRGNRKYYSNEKFASNFPLYSTNDTIDKNKNRRSEYTIKKQYELKKIELNSCDTNDIMKVPQFGAKRAKKIVEYRDRLGGFADLSQLLEIFSLQDFKIEYLEKYFYIDEKRIKKLFINSADYKELIQHPYMDAYLVKTVLQYREKNGKIDSITEFQQCTHAYEELIKRLTPYLSFD